MLAWTTARLAAVGVVAAALAVFALSFAMAPPARARLGGATCPERQSAAFSWEDCAPRRPHVLVYNRIPKAGSSTMIALIQRMAERNDFDFVLPVPYYNHTAARGAIFAALASGRRTLVCNHFNFPQLLYADRVAYMNIVRKPVERCTSVYYYTRYGDRARALKADVLARYGNQSLDECMARPAAQLAACFNCPPAEQALAFCGREDGDCGDVAHGVVLHRAWANVQAHFFVGVTEHLAATVDALAAIFPDFFAGAPSVLSALPEQKVTHTRAEYRQPSAASQAAMAAWAGPDEELYARAAAQFWRLHSRCVGDAAGG
jgi:hypothetical protein